MLNHPHITSALVDARHQELRADAATTRTRADAQRRPRTQPGRGLRAALAALLGSRRTQPQARVATEPCKEPC
jgi:hypothetical protein